MVCPPPVGWCCVLVLLGCVSRCLVVCLIVPLRERLLLGRSRGGRVVCLSLGPGACPWVVVSVPLGFAMSRVSLSLSSHSSSFANGLRFLSDLAVDGSLSVSFCSYGTGSCYVSFVPLPAAAPLWPAVEAVAFVVDEGGVGDLEFAGSWSVGGDNSRAAACQALLERIIRL